MMEFIKQIHHNSLTTFIFGPQQTHLESNQDYQLWYLDSQTESVSTILSYCKQSCNGYPDGSQSDKPISIHFSSSTKFDFLQSEFINLFEHLNMKKFNINPIHLHLPLNCKSNETLQESSNHIFNFYQLTSDLDLNSMVIYFSGNHLNQSISINFSNFLGKLELHLLHIYDETENSQAIQNTQDQSLYHDDELENLMEIHKSNLKPIEEILDLSLILFSPEIEKSNQINPYFQYTGSKSPSDIYVLLNTFTSSQLRFTIKRLLPEEIKNRIGLIEIKVLKPWSMERFLKALPFSTQTVRVFSSSSDLLVNLIKVEQSDHKRLQEMNVLPLSITSNLDSSSWIHQIQKDLGILDFNVVELPRRLDQTEKLIIFWDLNTSANSRPHISNRIASNLNSKTNRIFNEYDNFSNLNSIRRHSLFCSDDHDDLSIKAVIQNYSPSVLVIEDFKELSKTYDLVSKIDSTSNILFISKNINDFKDLENQVDIETRYKLWKTYSHQSLSSNDQDVRLGKVCNLKWFEDLDSVSLEKEIVIEIGVLILLFDESTDEDISERIKLERSTKRCEEEDTIITTELIGKIRNRVEKIDIPDIWKAQETNEAIKPEDEKIIKKPDEILHHSNQSFSLQTHHPSNLSKTINQTLIEKQILFPEYYQSNFDLRPDINEKTYLLKVIENRKLTPKDYERNVFHLSLSIKETKLKYSVGDALGIYGWNSEENEIKSFIKWLNFKEDEIIEMNFSNQDLIPQYMTIFKCFQQFLDLFGKPNKSFYETLSKKVFNQNEKYILKFISSSLGNSMIKKLSEVDKLNYIDIIKRYAKSHQLTMYDLILMIPLIKPRHYSIASSHNFKPDCIDLLIVEVNWKNYLGIERKGQCTGYLNNLRIGDQVLVCLKDSVMRLPEVSTQPIIMAGLGTGMAPFRAFIQERAYQRNVKGLKIGPILYYFGSRSRSSEYLYGDEIEEYLFEGIITHLRLSFSRDKLNLNQKKEYIQDLMKLDQNLIIDLLLNSNGHFYLCGPTWPVQDIYNVLLDGVLMKNELIEKEVGVQILEDLKNQERYVLEVY